MKFNSTRIKISFIPGILILGQLLAACNGGISPTVSPTSEATKPAMTEPLPTEAPTIPPTPTEIPTPAAAPMPGKDAQFPGTWETHADPQQAQIAFEELYAKNANVRADSEKMKSFISQIAKNQGIDNLEIKGYYWRQGTGNGNWALVVTDTTGNSYIYQVKTEQGWLNNADGGGYALLNNATDLSAIRLVSVNHPIGTLEADNLNGYTTFVLVDEKSQMVAFLNTAKDEWVNPKDGSPYVENNPFVAFNPEATTEADCRANIVRDPFTDPEGFKQDIALLHRLSKKIDVGDMSPTRVNALMNPISYTPANWLVDRVYAERLATNVNPAVCGIINDPEGNEIFFLSLPYSFTLQDGTQRIIFIPTIMDNSYLLTFLQKQVGNKTGSDAFNYNYSIKARIDSLKIWDRYVVAMLVSDGDMPLDDLAPEEKLPARYYNYARRENIAQGISDLVRGQGTEETAKFIEQKGFTFAYNIILDNLNNTPLQIKP